MLDEIVFQLKPLGGTIGLLWLYFLLVAIWLVWRRRWVRALGALGVLVFLSLAGSTSLPAQLLATLERPYSGNAIQNVSGADAVIMLGGTLQRSARDPFGFDLGPAADRALLGAELVRARKARVLVLGGGGDAEGSEAKELQGWFSAWGLSLPEVIRLEPSLDTHDEAEQVRTLAEKRGWKRLILVTSGFHMRRAEAVFRSAGLNVTPVACDFTGLATLEADKRFRLVPSSGGFQVLDSYLHEKVGWAYYRWKGWIRDGPPAPAPEGLEVREGRPVERVWRTGEWVGP